MNLNTEHRVHLVVSSRFENIELAQYVLDETLTDAGYEEEIRHWMGLALREAMANAIKHGNRMDPEKCVDVTIDVHDGLLELTVEDSGSGFDPSQVPDPLAPENRFRSEGRGIFYMRKFMDEVSYLAGADGGTRVRMLKRLGATVDKSRDSAERKELV